MTDPQRDDQQQQQDDERTETVTSGEQADQGGAYTRPDTQADQQQGDGGASTR